MEFPFNFHHIEIPEDCWENVIIIWWCGICLAIVRETISDVDLARYWFPPLLHHHRHHHQQHPYRCYNGLTNRKTVMKTVCCFGCVAVISWKASVNNEEYILIKLKAISVLSFLCTSWIRITCNGFMIHATINIFW